MTRIHGIAALSGRTYESVRHALELFVDAGCPREDRDHTGRKAFAYVYNDEHKETVSLFPPLPDRFAMMVLVDFVVRWFQKDGGKCRFIHGYFSRLS